MHNRYDFSAHNRNQHRLATRPSMATHGTPYRLSFPASLIGRLHLGAGVSTHQRFKLVSTVTNFDLLMYIIIVGVLLSNTRAEILSFRNLVSTRSTLIGRTFENSLHH